VTGRCCFLVWFCVSKFVWSGWGKER